MGVYIYLNPENENEVVEIIQSVHDEHVYVKENKRIKKTINSQNKLSIGEKNNLIKLYLSGKSITELSNMFDISRSNIGQFFKRQGIERRGIEHRKNKFNYNFFDNIDSEEKAYFFGLLFADGNNCIQENKNKYRVSIELQEKDSAILEKFKKAINFDAPLLTRKAREGKVKSSNQKMLIFNNKHFSENLREIGLVPRKTFVKKFPKINENLIRHFIRGYFDGNGCLTINKNSDIYFSITSSEFFINDVLNILNNKFNKKWKRYKNGNISCLLIGGNVNVYNICDWLYSDATIFLQRKFDKFLEGLRLYGLKDFKQSRSDNPIDINLFYKKYAII